MDARACAAAVGQRLDVLALGLGLLAGLAAVPLALPYRGAGPTEAHAVVAAMPAALRGVHAWAASLAVVALLLHLLRAWVRGDTAALAPRAWFPLLVALALLLAGIVGGSVLAWDQQGWESWQHLRAGLGLAPATEPAAPLGPLFLAHLASGLAALALLAAPLRSRGRAALRADLRVLAAPLALAAVLGLALPPALGPAPIPGLAVSKPDWPFLWLVPLQEMLGAAALPVGAAVGLGALAALPWLGRAWPARARGRAVLLGLVALLALSAWGALA